MVSLPLIVYGAGGHARVVLDALRSEGKEATFLVDGQPSRPELDGLPVLASSDARWLALDRFRFVVAIGRNDIRALVYSSLIARGGTPATIIHRSAVISPRAAIGLGSVVMAGVVVNAGALVGVNTILNTACSVDHDCQVGEHAHICPGTRLAGGCKVGDLTMLGTGTCVIPGVCIGNEVVVGAGSVLVRDLADRCRAFGNPARVR